jgi:hypothetical protein
MHNICEIAEPYRIGWRDHMLKMMDNCQAKTASNYMLRGCHAVGRLRKRWWEQI